jgi:hypothetical protein
MKMAVFWVVGPALMMEAIQTSETLVNSYQSTRCYNAEDSHLQEKQLEELSIVIFTGKVFRSFTVLTFWC